MKHVFDIWFHNQLFRWVYLSQHCHFCFIHWQYWIRELRPICIQIHDELVREARILLICCSYIFIVQNFIFRLNGIPEPGDFSCFSRKVTSKRRRVCSETKKSFVDPNLQFHFDNFDYVQGCDINRISSKWMRECPEAANQSANVVTCQLTTSILLKEWTHQRSLTEENQLFSYSNYYASVNL